jgi:hypothetical protein
MCKLYGNGSWIVSFSTALIVICEGVAAFKEQWKNYNIDSDTFIIIDSQL